MLLYKNTFDNIKTENHNFPVEDQYYATDTMAIVADGITRDPVGVFDLSSISNEEFIKKYPRPSGAELAAKTICETYAKALGTPKERLIRCNQAVKALNDRYIATCDYLQNDYYGAVAAAVTIQENTLYYAYICDCGVIIYDKDGNIKFQTEDDKTKYSDSYINKIGIPWDLPESRVIVRRDYRNNPENIQDGHCVSYGALTGEDTAIQFIQSGTQPLSSGDLVVVYSDGISNFLHEPNFVNKLLNFNSQELEEYMNTQASTDYSKYGKEKTIVLLKKE